MFKNFINIFLNYFGYKISKSKIYSFDHIYSYPKRLIPLKREPIKLK